MHHGAALQPKSQRRLGATRRMKAVCGEQQSQSRKKIYNPKQIQEGRSVGADVRSHASLSFSPNRIDCAGILKLRNSDIELRKGETDIGRKNTRVRMVFRVHVTQPGGRTVSLQVASNPIECCESPKFCPL